MTDNAQALNADIRDLSAELAQVLGIRRRDLGIRMVCSGLAFGPDVDPRQLRFTRDRLRDQLADAHDLRTRESQR
ncbi:hypothetical protein ACI8AC_23735 [Geodermatophilus sp. SYSU D00758]